MIHIEKTTGRSYPITEMTDEHLKKVIEYYINQLKIIGFKENIRYIQESENIINRLMPYLFAGIGIGIVNSEHINDIKSIYEYYKNRRNKISIKLMPILWDSDLVV